MTQSKPLHTETASDSNANLIRNATWGAVLLTAVGLAFFAFAISLVNFHDWQDYILVGFPLLLAGVSLASIFIMRRGQIALGSGMVFALNLVVPLLLVFIVRDTLWTASSYLVISSALLIWQAMPRRSWRWSFLATSATLLVVVVVNLINPSGRFTSPAGFNIFITIVLTILSIAFTAQAARQAWSGNIRVKMIFSFVLITVIGSWSVVFFADRAARATLTDSIGNNLSRFSTNQASQIGQILENELNQLNTLAITSAVQQRAEAASAANKFSQSQIDTLDKEWRAADAANNNADPLVAGVLKDNLTAELLKYQAKFPENVEVFLTDLPGVNIASTDRTSDYLQSDEAWWQATYKDGQYIGQPEFDASSKTLAINMAVAVRAQNSNKIIGILRTTVNINSLANVLSAGLFGQTGQTSIYLPDGQEIKLVPNSTGTYDLAVEKSNNDINILTQSVNKYQITLIDNASSLVSFANVSVSDEKEDAGLIKSLGWYAVTHQDQSEGLAPVTKQTQNNVILAVVITILAALAALGLAQLLSGPIVRLTAVAEQIAAGNNTLQAKVETSDEVGTLASTFNNMTAQLQNTLQGLEQRVADRTRNLELAAEVARSVSQVRSLDVMLKDACELILKEFNLYYVQVYLTDRSQTTLKLEAGTGNVGEQLLGRNHSLPLNTGSINGRAAIEKRSVVIADTTQSATFRQNPLLPNTRGEMAVPLIVADKVVGVLDMQSNEPGILNAEVLPAFEALAGQLAVAIQNANLVAETEQARAQVESQARRLVHEGWNEHLDAIHKPEHFGFVFDHNTISPLVDGDESQLPDSGHTVSASISVTGESLGSLVVEIDDEARREQNSDLVNIVARQVAQQIENLRLLESAERYRYEAEKNARLQTIEGWQDYISSRETNSLGYLYNSNEVVHSDNTQEHADAMTLPVNVRDEKIGKLSIQGLNAEDTENVALANVVAERLGAHIESLRLFEETKRGQLELDKRARQLAAVAEISTVSSKELDIQKMLESVVHLTQRKFGLYHAHVFVYSESTDTLDIRACGYKEGDEHEGTHGTAKIPLTQEQSLVARAARTKKAVIVNNVLLEPGWLPNPLLPDTVSELAVPLVIGDQVLGVLDVQSDRLNAFTEEDANIQTTLASQVATAMQNARSFNQAQKQADRESMLNVINQKIQSATSVEAVLQIAARELGHALGAPMTVAQLSMKDKAS